MKSLLCSLVVLLLCGVAVADPVPPPEPDNPPEADFTIHLAVTDEAVPQGGIIDIPWFCSSQDNQNCKDSCTEWLDEEIRDQYIVHGVCVDKHKVWHSVLGWVDFVDCECAYDYKGA